MARSAGSAGAHTAGGRVPNAVAPPAGHPRFPLLDGVRAIGALSVLVTHVAFATTVGWTSWYRVLERFDVGVTIFFVVAGFLLFRPYLADYVDGVRAPGFGRYLLRRALRILPGYWVALSVVVLAGWVTLDSGWWEHYTLTQIYDGPQWFAGIGASWSLCTEVAFYALLPLLVMTLRAERPTTRSGRVRAGAWLVAFVFAISWVFRITLRSLHGTNNSIWFNTLPGMLDWFALGMALAVVSVAVQGSAQRPRAITLVERWPGISWLLAAVFFTWTSLGFSTNGGWGLPRSGSAWLLMHVLYGGVAVCIVLPAVFPGDGRRPVHRVLGNPVAGSLGLISYGIFLYNGPIVSWVVRWKLLDSRPFGSVLFVTLVLSVIAGTLSYVLVERPLLWFKDARIDLRLPRIRSRMGETETPAA